MVQENNPLLLSWNRESTKVPAETSETAVNVGKRHGKPVVLVIDAKQMAEDGHKFFLSRNGVWLTDYVDMKYIKVSSDNYRIVQENGIIWNSNI